MCGIAGWVDSYEDLMNKENTIKAMSNTLINRGPDAGGIFTRHNVCLIHRRLIVVDPENGKQPMNLSFKNQSFTMVYNGELYNTDEVKKELFSLGHSFNGHSDTEVLLHAYVEWGVDCLSKLNGIYAFAVWNEAEQNLFLARDRMGVKPLFLYPYENGLIFASQIKTLLQNEMVKPQIDQDGLKELFLIGPGRTCGNGIIKGIIELKPGEYGIYSNNKLDIRKYWQLTAKEHTDDLNSTIEKTRFLIIDAIEKQLVSDVPLCCFLSGGLDSSIISKIASDSYKKNNSQLDTYSVDYIDNEKYFKTSIFQPNSDMTYIKLMVDYIGSNHHEIILDNTSLAKALESATYARDLPGMADIDSSLLLFCEIIKKDFTVGLSGECADELFGGYPWYHNDEMLFADSFPWSQSVDLRASVLKQGVISNTDLYVKERYNATIKETSTLPSDNKKDIRMREMFMLNINWFMQTLLDRKDRMSMHNGLEVRVPFCDHRIVEYAYNMPWEYKSLYGREKGIVREAMKGLLPEEIIYRKKSPYPKTQNPIYMALLTQMIMEIKADKNSPISDILNWSVIEGIIANPEQVVTPWYGQLMKAPQMLAYIIQVNQWFKMFNISIV